MNNNLSSQLSFHFFPVLADRNSIVWENVVHAGQKTLWVKVWVQFSCNHFLVHCLWGLLQSLRHLHSDLFCFQLQYLHWNILRFQILWRRTQDLGRNIVSKISNNLDFGLLIFLRKSFRNYSLDQTSLHSDTILVSLMNVDPVSSMIWMQGNNSSDSNVFLKSRNQNFQLLECIWWVFVLWENVQRWFLLQKFFNGIFSGLVIALFDIYLLVIFKQALS